MLGSQTLQLRDVLWVLHVIAFGEASKQNNAALSITNSPQQHIRYTLWDCFLFLSIGHISNRLLLKQSDESHFGKNWLRSDHSCRLPFPFQIDFHRRVLNRKAIHGLRIRKRTRIDGNGLFDSCITIKQKPESSGFAGESFTGAFAEYGKEGLFVIGSGRENAEIFRRYRSVAALHNHAHSLQGSRMLHVVGLYARLRSRRAHLYGDLAPFHHVVVQIGYSLKSTHRLLKHYGTGGRGVAMIINCPSNPTYAP